MIFSLGTFREELRVERAGKKNVFDMDQSRRIFNSCRIPLETVDELHCHFKTGIKNVIPCRCI